MEFWRVRQMYKQIGSSGINALKPTVFLDGSEFRLRILFGKPFGFPNPSAMPLQTVFAAAFL